MKEIEGGVQPEGQPTKFTVAEAKEYFEKNITELKIFSRGEGLQKNVSENIVTPLWSKGKTFSEGADAFVEVPFNLPMMRRFRMIDKNTPIPEEEKYNNTEVRLLAQKNTEWRVRI
ncbi:MAG: hypothetical protein LBH34_02625 [Prevotellaceae bacterium]|jgi:hypothetical protein|nr:hypothetical protein [Prevotellaceae bacterium]